MDESAYRTALAAASPRVPVTVALVATNVCVALAATAGGMPLLDPPPPEALARWGANIGPLTADREGWRILTSVFVHVGVAHLAVNMAALADLGRTAERLFGSVPFLFLYLASGMVGAACSVAWNPWVFSAGASGAIFGVLGALVVYSFAGVGAIPRRLALAHWLTLAGFLAFTVLVGLFGAGIDHAAHLGGFACGAVLGRILARPLPAPRPPLAPQRRLLAIAVAGFALAAAAAGWRSVAPAYAEQQRFVAAVRAHVAADRERIDQLRDSFDRWQRREVPPEAHSADLARYAAELREVADRLGAFHLAADSPARPRAAQAALVAALGVRADAVQLRAGAVAQSDRAIADDADRRIAEAEMLWLTAVCGDGGLFRCPKAPAPGNGR